jgi:hypothetical protein
VVAVIACGLIGLVASADRSSIGSPFAAAAPGSGRLPDRALEGPVERRFGLVATMVRNTVALLLADLTRRQVGDVGGDRAGQEQKP